MTNNTDSALCFPRQAAPQSHCNHRQSTGTHQRFHLVSSELLPAPGRQDSCPFLLGSDSGRLGSIPRSASRPYSTAKAVPIWDMIVSWFFGGTMLFPGFTTQDYHNKKGFEYKAIFMDVYDSTFAYVFAASIFGLIMWSYFKNFKNKFVQILMISFFVDIIIHCILQFGLKTGYIYGAQYIFIVPLLLGWLFHAYRKSPKVLSLLMVVSLILMSYLFINNLLRMREFFWFLEIFYKV